LSIAQQTLGEMFSGWAAGLQEKFVKNFTFMGSIGSEDAFLL
jgi:hypothetical protein